MAEILIDSTVARSKVEDFGRTGSQPIKKMKELGFVPELPTAEACLLAAQELQKAMLQYQELIVKDHKQLLDFIAKHEQADQT